MNISDSDGPLSTNIIIVLTAYVIIKADQTARRKQCLTPQPGPPLVPYRRVQANGYPDKHARRVRHMNDAYSVRI